METSFDERKKSRAENMLPPETAMLVECSAEEFSDRFLQTALEHIIDCGLGDKPLCTEAYTAIQTRYGVLLRCELCTALDAHGPVENTRDISLLAEKCAKNAGFPVILGIGLGKDHKTAVMAAVEALARPVDTQNPDAAVAQLEYQISARSGALAVAIEKGDGAGLCHVAVSCAYNRRG